MALFPETVNLFHERFFKKNKVRFDVYRDMERLKLIDVYRFILHADQLQFFIVKGTSDEDLLHDLNYTNTHIAFAYGIKHGYIQLSGEPDSLLSNLIYEDFELEYDDLVGEDGEMYSTQMIYDNWEMEKWIDLLP